jgi:hypothetical protein
MKTENEFKSGQRVFVCVDGEIMFGNLSEIHIVNEEIIRLNPKRSLKIGEPVYIVMLAPQFECDKQHLILTGGRVFSCSQDAQRAAEEELTYLAANRPDIVQGMRERIRRAIPKGARPN